MRANTKIMIYCGGVLINERSQVRGGHGYWSNPIEFIPNTGDKIEIAHKDTKTGDITLKLYQVQGRRFKASETYSNGYEDRICMVKVIELNHYHF
jgi:hypothetical protein